jgi:hypothetical protein
MNQLPPPLRDQRKIDAEHLNLLSIFHFVGVGLAGLGVLFILLHYTMLQAVFSNDKLWQNQNQEPLPAEFFAIFKWLYVVFAVWFVGSGILNLLAGLFIRARKHRTFCLIVSGVNCMHFPLGTTLGVFTMIVLLRDSVRELYET